MIHVSKYDDAGGGGGVGRAGGAAAEVGMIITKQQKIDEHQLTDYREPVDNE